jgi:esterase/lipase superfamily enzyme
MQVEHHSWWSPHLSQDMELHVYGYFGKPLLVFPAQGGRCHEFADFGMLGAIAGFVEAGQVKVFTVDSIDQQSWANAGSHPADRARRHEDYDRYITREVVPFISKSCEGTDQKYITTGCSMGGYHAANFFFRHPDIFDGMISLSGLFQLHMFLGDFMDETVYFNSPIHYLQNLSDPWYLERYRQSRIVVCAGQGAWEDDMLADAYQLKQILDAKGVPNWTDIWGYDVNHDWPWWQKMLPHVLGNFQLPSYSPPT